VDDELLSSGHSGRKAAPKKKKNSKKREGGVARVLQRGEPWGRKLLVQGVGPQRKVPQKKKRKVSIQQAPGGAKPAGNPGGGPLKRTRRILKEEFETGTYRSTTGSWKKKKKTETELGEGRLVKEIQ